MPSELRPNSMSARTDRLLSVLTLLVALWMITRTWAPPGLLWDLILLVAGAAATLYSIVQFVRTL